MLRKLRPSKHNEAKFGGKVAVPAGVIERQKVARSAAEMQRQCSAGVVAVFAITSGVFVYGEVVLGFNSRRLHFWQSPSDGEKQRQPLSSTGVVLFLGNSHAESPSAPL